MKSRRSPRHVMTLGAGVILAAACAVPLAHAATATGLRCASCVDSSDIRNGTVASIDIKNSTIAGVDVRNSSLTGADLKDGSVGVNDIADDAVGSAEVAAGAIGASELAAGAVGASALADGAIGSTKLVDGAVTASKLADGSVTSTKLAADSVGASAIAAGAVGTSEVADGSIATGDLAFDPVTSTELETAIDGFNASRSAQHDVTVLPIESTTATPMFGLTAHNRDGNDDSITVTRDTRLIVDGAVVIEGGATADPVVCSPWLDSDPYPAAQIGASSLQSVDGNTYTTIPISGSATVSPGTYDVYVACHKLTDVGADSFTMDGYLNVWLAEQ